MRRRTLVIVAATLLAAGAALASRISSPDTEGDVGLHTSLALDAAGNAVISYQDADGGDLKILHCNDPFCEGGDESIRTPDTAGEVGADSALVLDAAGHPVVAYSDTMADDLVVMHCNDPNCAGDDESVTYPDTAGEVGAFKSLALDGAGNPVISYFDGTNYDLKVMHCNDANCEGDDESIASPDALDEVGEDTSLALDAQGYPVISYSDFTNGTLKVMHCNDPNCTGGDESITSPDSAGFVGGYTSLALDAAGNPVVSYYDWDNGTLKVMHCNDVNCAGDDESITSPDAESGVGEDTSLALNADGHPVVAYRDAGNNDLKLMVCNDVNCAGDDEHISSPDTAGDVGSYLSLALDEDGDPVVSYYDATNGDLKFLRCTNPLCEPNVAPTAHAGADRSAVAGQVVSFSGSASDGNGDVLTFEWDFGDGRTAEGTLTPVHVFAAAGTYTVTLTVTDEGGLQASDSLTVTVEASEGHVYLPAFWR